MAIVRVDVKPELLRWACDRAGADEAALRQKFANFDTWMRGEAKPTLKQLEDFARATRVAVGYLFLPEPPKEKLPVRDMRTISGKGVRRLSPDLLDTIYLCQQRQEWYRDFAEQQGEDSVAFVGTATVARSPVEAAAEMRRVFDFDMAVRRGCSNPSELMRLLIERVESAGALVMVSGIVKNSTNRVLDAEEFRGFALADPLAPLVFVNGTESKPAQMFTLAHELAHLWLGESALSDAGLNLVPSDKTEKWCNHVAAEFLVPLAELKAMAIATPLKRLDEYRQTFKVSRLVVLRRLLDAQLISRSDFDHEYTLAFHQATASSQKPSQSGDFYNTLPIRASKRFLKAIIASTASGETTYTTAFQLLGIKSSNTLRELGRRARGV